MPDATLVTERFNVLRIVRAKDTSANAVVEMLANRGVLLKRNAKSLTCRVGDNVVKSSEGPLPIELIRHTFDRNRYRRAWNASLHLARHGIFAPRPVAHVEWSVAGMIWRHATVMTFIDGCQDVEHFFDSTLRDTADSAKQAAYLSLLAEAVNALVASGAIHTDLAGKNILTRDGETFFFIDLDGVLLDVPFDESRQLQLHVQLYDSFVDRCGDDLLAPFIEALHPHDYGDFQLWFGRVKAAQALRRAKTVAAWKREGKQ